MLYLSKGIAEKDSTENLIKVRRGDYTYTVSGNTAKLWLAGRFGFAACDTDEEISDILNLAKMGLAEYETEECQASWYRILARCVCVPQRKGLRDFSQKRRKLWCAGLTLQEYNCLRLSWYFSVKTTFSLKGIYYIDIIFSSMSPVNVV